MSGAKVVGIVADRADAIALVIRLGALLVNGFSDILVAAAKAIIVVQVGHAVSDFKNVIKLTVGEPLHHLSDFVFHVRRQALRLRLFLVMEKAAIKSEPHATGRLDVPQHNLLIVVVAVLVRVVHVLGVQILLCIMSTLGQNIGAHQTSYHCDCKPLHFYFESLALNY